MLGALRRSQASRLQLQLEPQVTAAQLLGAQGICCECSQETLNTALRGPTPPRMLRLDQEARCRTSTQSRKGGHGAGQELRTSDEGENGVPRNC